MRKKEHIYINLLQTDKLKQIKTLCSPNTQLGEIFRGEKRECHPFMVTVNFQTNITKLKSLFFFNSFLL